MNIIYKNIKKIYLFLKEKILNFLIKADNKECNNEYEIYYKNDNKSISDAFKYANKYSYDYNEEIKKFNKYLDNKSNFNPIITLRNKKKYFIKVYEIN